MVKQQSEQGDEMKSISVSQFPLTAENIAVNLWVTATAKDALGIIIRIHKGENDSYADIEWLDGAPTQHAVSGLIGDAVIKGAVASSLIPEWSR